MSNDMQETLRLIELWSGAVRGATKDDREILQNIRLTARNAISAHAKTSLSIVQSGFAGKMGEALSEIADHNGDHTQAGLRARQAIREWASAPIYLTAAVSAEFIRAEVLNKTDLGAARLREVMIDATMKTKAPSLTRYVRWSVVNDAIEALSKSEGL